MRLEEGITIESKVVRVYYNASNPLEPFCLDMGVGTAATVLNKIDLQGTFQFRYMQGSDPCAWIENSKHGDENLALVSIYLDYLNSFASITTKNK